MSKTQRLLLVVVSTYLNLIPFAAYATLNEGADVPSSMALTIREIGTNNAALEADIQAQTSICEANPNTEACGAARERIQMNQTQILNNSVAAQQLQGQMLNLSSQGGNQKLMEMAGLGDKLRQCGYAAAVACSLLGGPGKAAPATITDLAGHSLSGQGTRGPSSAPIRLPDASAIGGGGPDE